MEKKKERESARIKFHNVRMRFPLLFKENHMNYWNVRPFFSELSVEGGRRRETREEEEAV